MLLKGKVGMAQSVRTLHVERPVDGSSLFWHFFFFAHAQCDHCRHALVSWRHYNRTHMDFDAQTYDISFACRLFPFFAYGPDSPLEGPSLRQALGPHGSRGFLRKGEIACTLTGNWQNVLSEKWKEDCRNSWRVLAVNLEREILAWPLQDF